MNPSPPTRRALRLREYDYGAAGAYFVTVCTRDRLALFGEIYHGNMMLHAFGAIVTACWADLPGHFPNIQLNCFTVMPNHVHGLIEITDKGPENSVGVQHAAPVHLFDPQCSARIARGDRALFQSRLARRINLSSGTPGATIWQRNYYEHVIRGESELQRVREYIVNNPARWAEDEENPNAMR